MLWLYICLCKQICMYSKDHKVIRHRDFLYITCIYGCGPLFGAVINTHSLNKSICEHVNLGIHIKIQIHKVFLKCIYETSQHFYGSNYYVQNHIAEAMLDEHGFGNKFVMVYLSYSQSLLIQRIDGQANLEDIIVCKGAR